MAAKRRATPKAKTKTKARPKPAPKGPALVIVESPAKSRTINKILGPGYLVRASLGHVRDLPKRKFGIDVDHGFEPTYTLLSKRRELVRELKQLAENAAEVYLATDPDREGEAISWHLAAALKLPPEKIRRVRFHEITHDGIRRAFERPGRISMELVNAQQARRLLDRIVGYKLSPLLWRKIAKRLSAGRVQSVALKFVVDREREIRAFRREEYWSIAAKLSTRDGRKFEARLAKLDGVDAKVRGEAEARDLVEELRSQPYSVARFEQSEKLDRPYPPFTTSLLQQRAAIELGYSAKRTMMLAQRLYEGIELPGRGATGLITYLRTDSMRVAGEAIHAARRVIGEAFGAKYVPERPNFFKSRAAGAQEAHEAIRPTRLDLPPDAVRRHLAPDQFRLYRLIWDRFIASQMAPAVYLAAEADIAAGRASFAAHGRRLIFDGHLRLTRAPAPEQELPEMKPGDPLTLQALEPKQHFTEPPPRYTEASLIKALEKHGIGRPSTYAPTLSTLTDRGYVRVEARKLAPTELGCVVTEKLELHFEKFIHAGFTAQMEGELDAIEEGRAEWSEVLRRFYGEFVPELERAEREMEPAVGEAGEPCPKCGAAMKSRFSRFGKLAECACGFKKPSKADEVPGQICDRCGSAMAIKWSARGRFLSCTRYPDCTFTRSILRGDKTVRAPVGFAETCPRCGKPLALKGSFRGPFLGCSGYPACRFSKKVPRGWRVSLYPKRAGPPAPPADETEEKPDPP